MMRIWMRRGWIACVLWPLSLLFWCLMKLRCGLYRVGILQSTRLPVPVIVAGNIFIGGTGKTPLTIWLIEMLRRAGYKPGVISRGYGGHGIPQLVTANSIAQQTGDEPLLIARRTGVPVAVGRKRIAAAQMLLTAHPDVDVIVSDDGLQHYAMARNIEIVLFDARGAGNGWLLPAGPLRELVSQRRDFTVVNASCIPAGIDLTGNPVRMRLEGEFAERLSDRSQRMALMALQPLQTNKPLKILAAAGIGNPARFFDMLRTFGLIFDEMPLPDHFDFSSNPFARASADIILVTEKDAVKCSQIDALKQDSRLWVVPISAHIDGALAERIVEKLRGHSIA